MHSGNNYPVKVYVCFDSDNDFPYFRMMQTWDGAHNIDLKIVNEQDLRSPHAGISVEEIKDNFKNKIQSVDVFIVLIGESTRYLGQYVRWEMEQALALDKPIIGVNLNGLRYKDVERCPSIIENELAVHISFNALILEKALENWPKLHVSFRKDGKPGSYYYDEDYYTKLGL